MCFSIFAKISARKNENLSFAKISARESFENWPFAKIIPRMGMISVENYSDLSPKVRESVFDARRSAIRTL